jgi:hypothetical protein
MLELVNMSYFGIKFKYKTYDFIVRIHGLLDRFEVDPSELESAILKLLETYNGRATFNMLNVANMLAADVAAAYCNGDNMIWTEVQVDSNNRMTCGSSVAKLDLVS